MSRKKSAFVSLGVAAAICAAPVALANPAAAADAPADQPTTSQSTGVALGINARAKADTTTETASLAVYAYNNESVPVNIKFTTPYGEQSFTKIAPGKAAYVDLPTGLGTLPAGSVTVAGYVPASSAGAARYQTRTISYDGVVATLAPRGTANGNAWVHPQDGTVYLAGYFVNTGAHAVSVRLKTPYGNSEAQTVAPGKAAYLTVDTGIARVPAGSAVIAAYKWIEGKGYYTELPITTPEKINAAPVVTFTSPTVGDEVTDSVHVTGTATDDYGLEDDTVTLHLRAVQPNGKCGAFASTTVVPVAADGTWATTLDTSALAPGSYCITALTHDDAGTENVGGGTHLKSIVVVAPQAPAEPAAPEPVTPETPVETPADATDDVTPDAPAEETPAAEVPAITPDAPAEETPAAEVPSITPAAPAAVVPVVAHVTVSDAPAARPASAPAAALTSTTPRAAVRHTATSTATAAPAVTGGVTDEILRATVTTGTTSYGTPESAAMIASSVKEISKGSTAASDPSSVSASGAAPTVVAVAGDSSSFPVVATLAALGVAGLAGLGSVQLRGRHRA